MYKSLKAELTDKSLFITLDEAAGNCDAMLSYVHDRFEVVWHGDVEDGRVTASYDGGFLSFFAKKPVNYFATTATSTKNYPKAIVSGLRRELVSTDTYDSLRLTFGNIFSGFKFNHDKLRPVDVSEMFKKKDLQLKDGIALNVMIGTSSSYEGYPVKATHVLDDLIFEFSSDSDIQFKDVNKYIEIVTKVISLYTKIPIDPQRIEVGLKSERYEGMCEYATVEYRKSHEYSTVKRDLVNAVNINEAGNLLDCIKGAFQTDLSHELGIWFSFLEADYKHYYFDVTMSNMLSCAESVYYLLPQPDNSKRVMEYDVFLDNIKNIKITPSKLKKLINHGAKRAYTEPVDYETKISTLIKYSGKGPGNNADIAKYLSQLRNNLMHGLEPNWNYIVDVNGEPDYRVDTLLIYYDFRKVLSNVFIRYLQGSSIGPHSVERISDNR